MSTLLPPPPPTAPKPRRAFVPLSKDPEKRSIQIGVIGTVLFHVLLLLLAPILFKLEPRSVREVPPPSQQISVDFSPEMFSQPKQPPPQKFVEANPDAPENEPDKTNNFAARNQQVAQQKPNPDGKSDMPALEGKKDFESTQIVDGHLTQPTEPVDMTPVSPTPPTEKTVTAPKLEQIPLPGFEKTQGESKESYGSNVAKFAENAQPVPQKVEGAKNVPLIQGATSLYPEIDPQRPRPRPTITKTQNVRPAIFAENKIGTPNIGVTAADARFSNYGAYLQRLTEAVQLQWEKILGESKVYPPSGTWVQIKFILNSDGVVTRIVGVDNHSTDQGARACSSAITDRSPYGKWTDDMMAVLGAEQELTFHFYYQ